MFAVSPICCLAVRCSAEKDLFCFSANSDLNQDSPRAARSQFEDLDRWLCRFLVPSALLCLRTILTDALFPKCVHYCAFKHLRSLPKHCDQVRACKPVV